MSLLDDENILIEQAKMNAWDVACAAVINNTISQEVVDYLNESIKITSNGQWKTNWKSGSINRNHLRLHYSNNESIFLCMSIYIHFNGSLCINIADQKILEEDYGISYEERVSLIKDIMQQLDMFTKDDIYGFSTTFLYKNLK